MKKDFKEYVSCEKSFFYSIGAKIIAAICSFLLDILIARICGKASYNNWCYAYSIICIMNWLGRFGIDSATKTFVCKSPLMKEKYISAACILQFILTGILAVVYFIILKILVNMDIYEGLNEDVVAILYVGIVYSSLYSFVSIAKETYIGLSEFKNLFIITTIEYGLYLLLGIVGITIGGERYIIIGFAASLSVIAIYFLLYYGHSFCVEDLMHYLVKIFKYAKYLAASSIGGLVLTEMDTFMIGSISIDEVGIYSVAKQLITKATNIPVALAVSEMDKVSVVRENDLEIKRIEFRNAEKKVFMMAMVIAFCFIVLGFPFIEISYGKNYCESYFVLLILLVYFVLYSLTSFYALFLQYQQAGKDLLISYIIVVISNLILNVIFIYAWGAEGAAFASGISMIPYTCYLRRKSTKRFGGI